MPSWDDWFSGEGIEDGEEIEGYLKSCRAYLKRQILVYQHWPQREFDEMGYGEEKVFRDRNA